MLIVQMQDLTLNRQWIDIHENTNRCSHLIPQERCLSMMGFKRGVFSGLPYNKLLLGGREITKLRS